MTRIIIQNILLFLLPTVLYVTFVMLRRRGQPNGTASKVIDEAPLFVLSGLGIALAIAMVVIFADTESGKPGQAYTPPTVEDGRYVPGTYN